MVIGVPYNFLISNSSTLRRVLGNFTSEKWSFMGFTCLLLTPAAAYAGLTSIYASLLIAHELCDISDGHVYAEKEHGVRNGYGLYIDHMLDSIGACFVAYGTYLLLGSPIACVLGLALYHLIAIHSWLYKINRLARGESEGTYFAVALSTRRKFWLNVDDLKMLLVIAVAFHFSTLLILIDLTLTVILVLKVSRAILKLRRTVWYSTVSSETCGQPAGLGRPDSTVRG